MKNVETKLFPTHEALLGALKLGCDVTGEKLPCRAIVVIQGRTEGLQVHDVLLYNHGRDFAYQERSPILFTLTEVRDLIVRQKWPTDWVMLDRPNGDLEREWIWFDMDTLAPKEFDGQTVWTHYASERDAA